MYEARKWQKGDNITAEKLNSMEEGIKEAHDMKGLLGGCASIELLKEKATIADATDKINEIIKCLKDRGVIG